MYRNLNHKYLSIHLASKTLGGCFQLKINSMSVKSISAIFISLLFLSSSLFAQQRQKLSDPNISNRVETELMFQAEVPSYWIDAKTNDGIVTLTGTVNNLLAKTKAEQVAMAVKGVKGVINRIEVEPPYRSDEALKTDVENALLNDPAADSYELSVAADGGQITLNGTVQSWQEKQLAAQVVKGVKGVMELKNNVRIEYDTRRPDAEIRREIEQAIANSIRLERNLIEVEVNDNVVTLKGKVGSLNEKRQLKSYAWTAGVEEVNAAGVKIAEWTREEYLKPSAVQKRSDEKVQQAVEATFLYDPRISPFKIDAQVDNGVVTLTGIVDNLKAKRAAQANTQTVTGVTNIRNNIKVRPETTPGDEELMTAVNEAFVRSAEIERYEIDVKANDGVVRLYGEVDNYYEKFRAEDIASQVKGVLDIVNNIDANTGGDYRYYFPDGWNTYYPSPYVYPDNYYTYPLTDAQIKDNINDELWWSPFVNEDEVRVSVENGIATLRGTVDDWDEKNAAIENAYEGGADAVVDKLELSSGNDEQ